ncbi:MAG: four helix bundle protein [Candidatus Magasanikbacteria bacterium RIFCSPHIGHO2_01_FULL_47_8]|uniref:Four helix bundle protein n=1 Tax=Candidatus Magasanikbacteria bacterium RIFCSPHIGHO2_01_FULL_47_8 TaxID=1798673 RepID=A0A1F6MCS9_9BACT|nr:MAG: four helix bundle protein [Candidatus Magasanikbacteria bacterium RIFCSPHIGHO2_01_FULL_47_8]
MATIKTFNDLEVWKKAHQLVLRIYRLTDEFPKSELFGLTSQLRRATASVAANIVEGFRRHSLKDSINFYTIADASLEESKYHLLLAKDLHYISLETYSTAQLLAEEVGKLLTRWIQSQRTFLKA